MAIHGTPKKQGQTPKVVEGSPLPKSKDYPKK